jgi:hypothetical protein
MKTPLVPVEIGAGGLDLGRGAEGVLAGVDVLAARPRRASTSGDGRVAITFDHWQSISGDTELKAAAAAAFVLEARLERLDIPAQGMRDFDLVFSDGSREPIEITRSRCVRTDPPARGKPVMAVL